MAFDYKKEFKEFYLPPRKPTLVDVPPMHYVAVRGQGDPNEEGGAYQQALQLLYALSYTIKMSPKSGEHIPGYFAYVVPPLEGFWSLAQGQTLFDPERKGELSWISCIRLPDFVTPEVFGWAKGEVARKKKLDCAGAEYLEVHEGLCVQCLHMGSYDTEPATIEAMHAYAQAQGCRIDLSRARLHHEIYLSDPRRVAPERLKTVIRLPVAKA